MSPPCHEDSPAICSALRIRIVSSVFRLSSWMTELTAPQWIAETWAWLLRRELGLPCKEPAWLDYPAMMRMALTSPNVMCQRRPEWLWPFNFFFLPLLSDLDSYPAGQLLHL